MSIVTNNIQVHRADSVIAGKYVSIRFEGINGYSSIEIKDPELMRLLADEINKSANYLENDYE